MAKPLYQHVAEGGEPCLTAGERSVTRGWRNPSINRPRRGRTRVSVASRVSASPPTARHAQSTGERNRSIGAPPPTARRQPTVYVICSAEWVLFAPVGDDWMVRLIIRGSRSLTLAHPRLSMVRRLRRRMPERLRSSAAEAWQAAFGDACRSGYAHPRRKHGRPPSATHVGAVTLTRGHAQSADSRQYT